MENTGFGKVGLKGKFLLFIEIIKTMYAAVDYIIGGDYAAHEITSKYYSINMQL